MKYILVAFVLNLCFSVLELVGGILTGSIAILSDALHDLGDAVCIGFSYLFEKKSKRKPDETFTYGYLRYSVLGALLTNTILIVGSIVIIYNAILRIINPIEINYKGMIIFAIFGFIVNLIALISTSGGRSLNEKAVSLHMLEDVLGWVMILIGSVIIKFTGLTIIDPVMSIMVSLLILFTTFKSFKKIIALFLEKTPSDINLIAVRNNLLQIDGVIDIHHIHVWSLDGFNNYATFHVVSNKNNLYELKRDLKLEMKKNNITHTTVEVEREGEECFEKSLFVNHQN